MNTELYKTLIKKFEDTTTVTRYKESIQWVEWHLNRLSSEFGWLGIGVPIKHDICGVVRVSKVQGFVIHPSAVLVETGFGNIWYYECIQPTAEEIEAFDGECLVVSE